MKTNLKRFSTLALLKELDRRTPKEGVKKWVKSRKDLQTAVKSVIGNILSQPAERPVLYFTYPPRKKFLPTHFIDWVDKIALFYRMAERYEKQERGFTCCVDRAYWYHLAPECDKMLTYIKGENE